jgi:ubiquitin C-terminal hydrolase
MTRGHQLSTVKDNTMIELDDQIDLKDYQSSIVIENQHSRYELCGVVHHSGSLHGGHYTR